MSEDLKGLIEKIHEEGVKAAEEKSDQIQSEAEKKSRAIVENAEKKARKIVEDARHEVDRIQKSGEMSLKQAGRNTVIALKKEILSILDKLILSETRKKLTPEAVSKAISALVRNYKGNADADIMTSLSKDDLKNLEEGFFRRLEEETGKGITLKVGDDITAGFTISYDKGRSHYDFTDEALAEYIGAYLRPRLRDLLEDQKDR